jgi:hypothetical protein
MGAPALPAQRQQVTDPSILQRLNNLGVIKDKAAELRGKIQSPEGRIEQAFSEANRTEANQPFQLPAGSEYDFSQNMMSRLPFGDETAALGGGIGRYMAGKSGLASEMTFPEAWNYGAAVNRAGQEQYRAANPGGDLAGTVLGTAVGSSPTGAAAALGIRGAPVAARVAPTVVGRTAEGIRSGAGIGALQGAGEGDNIKDRARNMALGGAEGTILGAAMPLGGGALRAGRRMSGGYQPQIGGHVQRLEHEADQLYTQMDRSGVTLTPNATNRILGNLQARARVAGFRPRLHDNLNRPLQMLQDEMANPTFPRTMRGMDELRRAVRDSLPNNATPDERRILHTMVEGLDENLNRLTPRDLSTGRGNVRQALGYLQEGRRLVRQRYKAETVDNLFQNAMDKVGKNYTQAGLQTAMRQEFGALSKRIRTNPRERGRWTNEERAVIQNIVRGRWGENTMRNIGRVFSVRSKAGVGMYGASLPGSVYMGADPVTATAVAGTLAGVGEVAKRASTARGIMNAERLDNLIGTGQNVIQRPPVRQGLAQLRRFITPQASGETGHQQVYPYLRGLGDQLLGGY